MGSTSSGLIEFTRYFISATESKYWLVDAT